MTTKQFNLKDFMTADQALEILDTLNALVSKVEYLESELLNTQKALKQLEWTQKTNLNYEVF